MQEKEKATIGFGDVQNLSLDKVVSFLILGNYSLELPEDCKFCITPQTSPSCPDRHIISRLVMSNLYLDFPQFILILTVSLSAYEGVSVS